MKIQIWFIILLISASMSLAVVEYTVSAPSGTFLPGETVDFTVSVNTNGDPTTIMGFTVNSADLAFADALTSMVDGPFRGSGLCVTPDPQRWVCSNSVQNFPLRNGNEIFGTLSATISPTATPGSVVDVTLSGLFADEKFEGVDLETSGNDFQFTVGTPFDICSETICPNDGTCNLVDGQPFCSCTATPATVCKDGINADCTVDPKSGSVGSPCDDGFACTGDDQCTAFDTCQGSPIFCINGGTCQEAAGGCVCQQRDANCNQAGINADCSNGDAQTTCGNNQQCNVDGDCVAATQNRARVRDIVQVMRATMGLDNTATCSNPGIGNILAYIGAVIQGDPKPVC